MIEDRPQRQINFLKDNHGFEEYDFVKNVCGGNDFNQIKEAINQSEFDKVFKDFNIIAIHRSALSSEEGNNLIEYCKNSGKNLILFSGGISSINLQNLNKCKILTINSKDFYSKNLFYFLDNKAEELKYLAFGPNWELNIMAMFSDRLVEYLKDFEDKAEYQEIKSKLKISDWEEEQFFENKQDSDFLDKEMLENILNKVQLKIKEYAYSNW